LRDTPAQIRLAINSAYLIPETKRESDTGKRRTYAFNNPELPSHGEDVVCSFALPLNISTEVIIPALKYLQQNAGLLPQFRLS